MLRHGPNTSDISSLSTVQLFIAVKEMTSTAQIMNITQHSLRKDVRDLPYKKSSGLLIWDYRFHEHNIGLLNN